MGGGDHDAAIKVVTDANVGYGGDRGHPHDVGVGTARHESGAQLVLEHVGLPARIPAHDNLSLLSLVRAIVPAKKRLFLIA